MKEYRDFMCSCKPDGKERCEDTLRRVCRLLRVEPTKLLTGVVYNMQHLENWRDRPGTVWICGNIESIYSDMWAAINAEIQYHDEEEDEFRLIARIRVQCDLIEHGVARVYELALRAAEDFEASIAQSG